MESITVSMLISHLYLFLRFVHATCSRITECSGHAEFPPGWHPFSSRPVASQRILNEESFILSVLFRILSVIVVVVVLIYKFLPRVLGHKVEIDASCSAYFGAGVLNRLHALCLLSFSFGRLGKTGFYRPYF